MHAASALTRALSVLNHLALFAGLYPAGALLAASQFTGHTLAPVAVACAWATGASVYLLDRVKLADRFLDRADLAANAERFTWIRKHAPRVRLFGAALALTALLFGVFVHPAAAILVLAGHLAIVAYAHRSADPDRRARPKDIFLLKNAIVGAGIAFFVFVLLALDADSPHAPADGGAPARLSLPEALPDVLAGFAILSIVITADAALSDIDDVATDRPFGTRTIPAAAGPRVTALAFLAANLIAAAALAAWAAVSPSPPPRWPLYAWAALLPATAAPFALAPARLAGSLRPLIDARLPLLAALLAVIAALH